MQKIEKITPILWFDDRVEEAIRFYCSIFENSKLENITYYGGPQNMVIASFQLEGQHFTGLGGLDVKFTETMSFAVACDTQREIDYLWERLSEQGKEGRCGWLRDRFGILWQIVPASLRPWLNDSNIQKSRQVIEAMLQMTKIDIGKLNKLYKTTTQSEYYCSN
jgi:predicted 3-demethylubiquinone-9 3-methyltransferase (glyoxalase superfamily)